MVTIQSSSVTDKQSVRPLYMNRCEHDVEDFAGRIYGKYQGLDTAFDLWFFKSDSRWNYCLRNSSSHADYRSGPVSSLPCAYYGSTREDLEFRMAMLDLFIRHLGAY